MITRTLAFCLLASLITACAKPKKTPQVKLDNLTPAKQIKAPSRPVKIVKVPEVLALPGQLKKKPKRKPKTDKKLTDLEQVKKNLKKAKEQASQEPTEDGFINAIQVYPYTRGALYKLYAAVNQISDIALQPGEKLLSVSAGDTVRWVVGDTKSGTGANEQIHIQVKPIAPDLQTNLIINTDRRTYHLEMVSDAESYMSSLSWTYPHDQLITLKRTNAVATEQAKSTIGDQVSLKRLNFRYHIKGTAPWKPVRVFDDGHKVYIQFPSGMTQGKAPPLFVLGHKSKPTLVNYRLKHPYYIVDRLFAAAELREGENPQSIVRITRTDAVWK